MQRLFSTKKEVDDDSNEIKLSSNDYQNSTSFLYLTEKIKWRFDSNNKK